MVTFMWFWWASRKFFSHPAKPLVEKRAGWRDFPPNAREGGRPVISNCLQAHQRHWRRAMAQPMSSQTILWSQKKSKAIDVCRWRDSLKRFRQPRKSSCVCGGAPRACFWVWGVPRLHPKNGRQDEAVGTRKRQKQESLSSKQHLFIIKSRNLNVAPIAHDTICITPN